MKRQFIPRLKSSCWKTFCDSRFVLEGFTATLTDKDGKRQRDIGYATGVISFMGYKTLNYDKLAKGTYNLAITHYVPYAPRSKKGDMPFTIITYSKDKEMAIKRV